MPSPIGVTKKLTALIVIDMQQGMLAQGCLPIELESVVGNINQIADKCRQDGHPVILIQHESDPGSEYAPGSRHWTFLPELDRVASDIVIAKTTCDSFFQSKLESTLRNHGVQHLIICGWATDFCVDTTVRAAVSHRFDITVACDAHTLADREHLDASSIRDHHNKTWPDLLTPGTFIRVEETRKVLDRIDEWILRE